jgi:hypothetical protein
MGSRGPLPHTSHRKKTGTTAIADLHVTSKVVECLRHSGGKRKATNVPIASKERLFFPLRIRYPEPRTSKRAVVEGLFCLVIQQLLILCTICALEDRLDLGRGEAFREDSGEEVGFADVDASLPHLDEQIAECWDEECWMLGFDEA